MGPLLVLPLLDSTTGTVVAAVPAAFQQLQPTMRRSLTWDRDVEMTRPADFTAATGIPVYFCAAYCPWQRGSNENSNACFASTSDLYLGSAMSWSGQLPVACREDAGRADSSTSCRLLARSLWVYRYAWHPFAA